MPTNIDASGQEKPHRVVVGELGPAEARPLPVDRMSMLVNAGFLGGIFSGAALGAMVSPHPGVLIGASFGAFIGYFAGKVMEYEDQRKSERTRELDEIIGVTKGTLGTSRRNPPLPSEQILREAAQRRWVAEWMTPQAPAVAPRY